MVTDLIFYLFAAVTLAASVMVITARNPVSSVLFLVLAFFSASGLFVMLEAEFLAMVLVMVYMGAVAILFLFVVMMLDIDLNTLKKGFQKHLPLGIGVGGVMALELGFIVIGIHPAEHVAVEKVANTLVLGRLLFTEYLLPFEIVSLILLVALIGAVVLTHRERKGVKRQCVADQVSRRRDEAVELKKVASGEGA